MEILLGFVVSPIAAGIAASIFFSITKYGILRRENPFEMALFATPIITFCATSIVMLFFVYKGSPKLGLDKLNFWYKMAIVGPVVTIITALSYFAAVPYLRKRVEKAAKADEEKAEEKKDAIESSETPADLEVEVELKNEERLKEKKSGKRKG